MSNRQRLDVLIASVAQSGRGFAKVDGKAVFVSGALPGERVRIEITRSHKNYDEARVIERLESPYTTAPCRYADACGGCDWARWSTGDALAAKASLVKHELERIWGNIEGNWVTPVASPLNDSYRCRITLKLRPQAVGYYAEGTHEFVPIGDCLIAVPAIRRAMPELTAAASDYLAAGYDEVELRAGPNDDLPVVVLRGKGGPLPSTPVWARGITAGKRSSGDSDLRYLAAGVGLVASPRSFVQVNLAVNDLLVQSVMNLVSENAEVVDAYCGIGNFSIPLAAKRGCRVLGFEGNSAAIADARSNSIRLGIEAKWLRADEKEMIRRWKIHQTNNASTETTLLIDPPRAGAKKFLENMLRQGILPDKILYISCDPATLMRDLRLLSSRGYSLSHAQCFDMFPQTHHIETLALLQI